MQNNTKELFKEAVQLYKLKNFDKVYEVCKKLVQIDPSFADAYHLTGLMFYNTKKYKEASTFLEKAIFLNPNTPVFLNTLSKNLIQLKEFKKAVFYLDQAEEIFPEFVQTYNTKAKLYSIKGEEAKAIEYYRKSLSIEPKNLSALNNISNLLIKNGQTQEAEDYNIKVLKIKPEQQQALMNSGNFKKLKDDIEGAKAMYLKSYNLNKTFVQPLIILCELLLEENKGLEIIEHLNKVLKNHKENSKIWLLLGQAHQQLTHYEQASNIFQTVIKLKPKNANAWYNYGNCAHITGDISKAVESYKKSLSIDDNNIEVNYSIARAYYDLKQFDKAKKYYKISLEINPDNSVILFNHIKLKASICDWSKREEDTDLLLKHLIKITDSKKGSFIPMLDINYYHIPIENHIKAAKNNAKLSSLKVSQFKDKLQFQFKKEKKDKLRIAYISPDFRNHPVGKLLSEFFKYHNRNRYEIYAYALVVTNKEDEHRENIKKQVDVFRDISKLPFYEAAKLIYNDNIDILIDLAGYTTHSKPEILALKPAPVQAQFLGYPDTMGADYMDYIIADNWLIPQESQKYYTEEIAYLPNTFLGSELKISAKTFTKTDFGIPEDAFVFCSFCSAYKYEPKMFKVWMELLKEIPKSILWLSKPNSEDYENNILKFAADSGISENRIFFAEQLPDDEYLSRYRLCDLFLDTLYYSAGSTAIAALFMNVPVLTVTLETNASRMGASICASANISEFITNTLEGYKQKAKFYAQNKKELEKVKHKLQSDKCKLPLFNLPGFAENIENVFSKMWNKYTS